MKDKAQLQENLANQAQAFGLMLADKGLENIGKWGMQDMTILTMAISEECGEVARAVLDHLHVAGDIDRAYQESIDLGALCIQLMLLVREARR